MSGNYGSNYATSGEWQGHTNKESEWKTLLDEKVKFSCSDGFLRHLIYNLQLKDNLINLLETCTGWRPNKEYVEYCCFG